MTRHDVTLRLVHRGYVGLLRGADSGGAQVQSVCWIASMVRQSADEVGALGALVRQIQRQTTTGVVEGSPGRPKDPIPGSRTLSHHPGPSVENFQSSPRTTHLQTTKAIPPTHRRTISPKEGARAALAPNSQALPGAERAAGAPRGKGSPWWA